MRIIGIDPGLANTGYGVIDHNASQSRLVVAGCITTNPKDAVAQRLKVIHDELAAVIEQARPDEASMEQLFFCNNMKTAISVAQGRGVAILATAHAGLPLGEYTPLQIKQAVVGYGKASKAQVLTMVKAILGLGEAVGTDHAADALAAALCHAHTSKFTAAVARATKR